jgi:hypothetical protein
MTISAYFRGAVDRVGASPRILHEFEQDSVGGTRMDEGHQPAMSASARFRIDELEAFGLESAH